MQVEQTFDERGRKLAVKRASTPDEAARLRREADLLEIASHPGLVELVDFSERSEAVLRTGWVDGGALAGQAPLAAEEIAGVVAAISATLADLHDLGLVHGAVAPEHVVLDADGRPVLCSLGYGGLVGERSGAPPPVLADAVDPARAESETFDPAVDVYGVGAILAALVGRADGRVRGPAAETLRRLATRACAPMEGGRPTARALADALHDEVAGARLPGHGSGTGAGSIDPVERRRRERPLERWRQSQPLPAALAPRRSGIRPRTVGLTLLGLAAVGVGVFVASGRPSVTAPVEALPAPSESSTTRAAPPPTTAAPPPTTAAPPTTAVAPTTVARAAAAASLAPSRPGCPPVDGPLTADVDGDGCADSLRVVGGVVEGAGLRFAVGEPADVMAVGDWSCTGLRSLAFLRPATGEVFAFTGWATAGHPVDAVLVTDVPGGRSLRAADLDGDGCNELVVERDAGAPVVARPPKAKP